MTSSTQKPRRPRSATIALVTLIVFYALELTLTISNIGQEFATPNRTAVGIAHAIIYVSITVICYMIVVSSAPSLWRWIITGTIGVFMSSALVQTYMDSATIVVLVDSSLVLSGVIVSIVVCGTLAIYYFNDPITG